MNIIWRVQKLDNTFEEIKSETEPQTALDSSEIVKSNTVILRREFKKIKANENLILESGLATSDSISINTPGGIVNSCNSFSVPGINFSTGSMADLWKSNNEIYSQDRKLMISMPEVITVSKNFGAAFTTIKAAVEEAKTRTGRISVLVHPGVYIEDNPIILPEDICVCSHGSTTTTVVAANPSFAIFEMNQAAEVNGLALTGANQIGGCGAVFNGSLGTYATLRDCSFFNCYTGAESHTGPGILIVEEAILASSLNPDTTINTCFHCHSGGDLRVFISGCSGRSQLFLNIGAICENLNSFMLLNSVNFQYVNTGIILKDCASLELQSNIIKDIGTGIKIEPESANLIGNAISVKDSTNYSLDIQATEVNQLILNSCTIKITKINNPNLVDYNIIGFSNVLNDEKQFILGDLSIGSVPYPTKSSFGQGNSSFHDSKILSESAGIFTDLSNSLFDFTVKNTEIFPNLSNSVLYIGRNFKFTGIYYILSRKLNPGTGNLVFEYWKNTAWSSFHFMNAWAQEPYYTNSESAFLTDISLSGSREYSLRFGNMKSWNKSSVNSLNLYWIRIRIESDILESPLLDQVKFYASSTDITKSGSREYFGNARPIKSLDWDINTAKPAETNPQNSNLFLSVNLNAGRNKNSFANNTRDKTGIIRYIPADMDTGCPIILIWSWMCSEAGNNIAWRIRWGTSMDSDSILTDSSTVSVFETERDILITETAPSTVFTQKTNQAELEIPEAIARGELTDFKSDIIWISLEREGDTDTNAGAVFIINISPHYTAWRDGAFNSMF